ncbi:MAG TPA: LysE family transporter [Lysobacter sp.]
MENITSFLVTASLIIVAPGPATFYVAGKAQHSARTAGLAIAGILAGDIVLIVLAGLGFSALVSKWPMLLSTIKVGGALYVAYLGIGFLRSRPKTSAGASVAGAPMTAKSFFQGILVTLTNPKPILFFAVFFPMFISKASHSWIRSFYALGGLFEILSLTYLSAVALLIMTLRRSKFLERSSASGLSKLSGCCLIACSALILASTFANS